MKKTATYYLNFLQPPLFLILFFISIHASAQYPAGSPVALNGKLKVSGTNMVSECGNVVQLRGMSSHGLQWFESCLNGSALDALTNDWKVDIFRLAMYVEEQGYVTNPTKWKAYIDNMVDECGKRGIYCLIDWHVMTPGDPNATLSHAREFWEYMSAKHAGKKHVLYEICNEPNGVSWGTIKNYANDIIPRIRANDPSTIIIVGTPTYSQDVDVAANDKLNYSNLMYTLHFYAGTHGQSYRDKGNAAIQKGLALFVTEFGTSTASGDGGPYLGETESWMNWMASNKISWCQWSFCDKAEASAALSPGACAASGWNTLTQSGTWVKGKINTPDNFTNCGNNIPPPVVEITAPEANASFITPASITIDATATAPSGTITKVDFYSGSTLIGSDNTAPYSFTWTDVPQGTYIIKAVATSSANVTGMSSGIQVYVNIPQTPYGATPWPIPGKIEAENYDEGGNNHSYYDNSGGNTGDVYRTDDVDLEATTDGGAGYAIGYTTPGEWVEYTVDVAATGKYDLKFRVASNSSGKTMRVEMDGANVTGTISIPNTGGWTTWQTVTVPGVNLTAGTQVMRIVFITDGYNFNYMEAIGLNSTPAVTITAPSNNSSYQAPATINLTATATDSDGTVSKVDFYNGTTLLGSDNTSPYTYTWSNVPIGTYSITARATDNGNAVGTSPAITVYVTVPQSAYGGTAWAIPGKIEAEEYDLGGSNNAFYDSDEGNEGSSFRDDDVDIEETTDAGGGYNVGWTAEGEWLEYSVNVAASGKYNIAVRVAAEAGGKAMHIEMNGIDVTGSISVPATGGWQTWTNITVEDVDLTSGPQIMKVVFDTDGINLNYVTVTSLNEFPTVSLTAPANNSIIEGPADVVLTATASDADGAISKVDFYHGSTLLYSDVSSPYSYTWANVAPGTYELTAKATDNSGTETTSSVVNLTVAEAQNEAPAVMIVSPSDNDTYDDSEHVAVEVEATDPDGSIVKVEIYNGSTLVHTLTSPPYVYSLTALPIGTHTLTVVVTDDGGEATTSEPVIFSVADITGLFRGNNHTASAAELYPNPSSSFFTVKVNEEVISLRVLNMYGEEIGLREKIRTGDKVELGAGLEEGTYVMHLQYASGKTEVLKLIKIGK